MQKNIFNLSIASSLARKYSQVTTALICKLKDLLEISANGQQNVKIANVFFRTNFPLYGSSWTWTKVTHEYHTHRQTSCDKNNNYST